MQLIENSQAFPIVYTYLIFYFLTLLLFFITLLFIGVSRIKYLTELSFQSNLYLSHFLLTVILMSFAGLPPLLLFLPKFSIISLIASSGSWFLLVLSLLLVFIGWVVYLTALKLFSNQSWSFSVTNEFGSRYISTSLGVALILGAYILIFGYFLFPDISLLITWVFIN